MLVSKWIYDETSRPPRPLDAGLVLLHVLAAKKGTRTVLFKELTVIPRVVIVEVDFEFCGAATGFDGA